jgi:membrane protein DedA with SNARE-associated domain
MEHITLETLNLWLTQYGSFSLFVLLALGIFALPLPDETIMVFAGVLISKQQLQVTPTLFACILGALCGMTLSYFIGRTAGTWLIKKYGHWIRLTETRMQRVHNWFERIGCWTLPIGYFIPGVRHLTGYAAGITKLEYRKFALFAYSGGIAWSATFISIGYFLGNKWIHIINILTHKGFKVVLIMLGVMACGGFLTWWLIRRNEVTRIPNIMVKGEGP